ncbi:hypothetical protein CPB97_000925, partial [Podila verticillata]
MRLITIGLGACALYALSVAQAENAPAAPAPAGNSISSDGLKTIDPSAYPSLKELEARVGIFNDFAANSKGKNLDDAALALATDLETKPAEEIKAMDPPAEEPKESEPKKEPEVAEKEPE